MKLVLASLMSLSLVGFSSTALAAAGDPTNFTCSSIKEINMADSTTGPNIPVQISVELIPSSGESEPAVTVKGLVEGKTLTMNYQDVFGHGNAPDGDIFFATRETGDGTIQDVCGSDDYTALIDSKAHGKIFCGLCK